MISDVNLVIKKINLLLNSRGGRMFYFYPVNVLCASVACDLQQLRVVDCVRFVAEVRWADGTWFITVV